jgi:hypothetical protein
MSVPATMAARRDSITYGIHDRFIDTTQQLSDDAGKYLEDEDLPCSFATTTESKPLLDIQGHQTVTKNPILITRINLPLTLCANMLLTASLVMFIDAHVMMNPQAVVTNIFTGLNPPVWITFTFVPSNNEHTTMLPDTVPRTAIRNSPDTAQHEIASPKNGIVYISLGPAQVQRRVTADCRQEIV